MIGWEDWKDWKPTPIGINSLPKALFDYICHIETLCDPAGIIAENTLLKDEIRYMAKLIEDRRNND